jgi:hypothetical protein
MTPLDHEPGDLGAEPVQEFPARLNAGYIVSHGGRGSVADCRMAAWKYEVEGDESRWRRC